MAPTYVAAVGRLGEAVAARLQASPPSSTFASCHVPDHEAADRPRVLSWFVAETEKSLRALLRAGATQSTLDGGGRGKLDLVLLADVAESGGSLLADLAHALSQVLAQHFAVMFPPDAGPHQRTVGLCCVLVTPALDQSAKGKAALRAVQGLEQWHRNGPPSPILNRVFLLPRQNPVMPLSDDDVERAAYLFISTSYSRLLRDTDAVRERLTPPRDPAKLTDSFAVAAADVEVERISDAFAWRSALAGLTTLCDQMQKPAPRHGSELDVRGWLRTADDDLRQGGEIADGAEHDALESFERDLRALADDRLGGDDGLIRFREVRDSLDTAAATLRELGKVPKAWLPKRAEPPPAVDAAPAAAPPEDDGDAPASPEATALAGVGLAAAVGVTAAALFAVAKVRTAAGDADAGAVKVTSSAAPIGADPLMAIVWGAIIGIAVGLGWAFASRFFAKRKRGEGEATKRYEAAVAEQVAVPESTSEQELRRRRLARGALARVEDEAARLDAMRAAVLAARDRAAAELQSLGVTVGETPDGDDYSRLFAKETPLHLDLIPATSLPRLWNRSRAVREDELWAARLLRSAFPRGGHRDDLPFAPGASWEQALRDQHAMLGQESVFGWPDVQAELATHVRRFFAAVPRSLELGVRPRNADGTPVSMSNSRDLLLVVPQQGRTVIDRALSEQPIADAKLFPGDDRLARVIVMRTAGEFASEGLG